MTPVRVVWVDSRELAKSWTFKDSVFVLDAEQLMISSVGHLYYEDENIVALMMNVGEDQVSAGIAIPRQAIISLTELS